MEKEQEKKCANCLPSWSLVVSFIFKICNFILIVSESLATSEFEKNAFRSKMILSQVQDKWLSTLHYIIYCFIKKIVSCVIVVIAYKRNHWPIQRDERSLWKAQDKLPLSPPPPKSHTPDPSERRKSVPVSCLPFKHLERGHTFIGQRQYHFFFHHFHLISGISNNGCQDRLKHSCSSSCCLCWSIWICWGMADSHE